MSAYFVVKKIICALLSQREIFCTKYLYSNKLVGCLNFSLAATIRFGGVMSVNV